MSNRIRYAGLVEEENRDKRKKTSTKKEVFSSRRVTSKTGVTISVATLVIFPVLSSSYEDHKGRRKKEEQRITNRCFVVKGVAHKARRNESKDASSS